MVMPLLFAGLVSFGASEHAAWRLAMVVPGVLLFLTGIAYYRLTQDTAARELRDTARARPGGRRQEGWWLCVAAKDPRVWALFVVYGACFGVELTVNNIGALYFHDSFALSVRGAGIVAGLHGSMNLFARTLGGYLSDKIGIRNGLRGRVMVLSVVLLCEGVLLLGFSRATRADCNLLLRVVLAVRERGLRRDLRRGAHARQAGARFDRRHRRRGRQRRCGAGRPAVPLGERARRPMRSDTSRLL